MAKKIEVAEELKLRWPDGCERTRIRERRPQHAWKKTRQEYQNMLAGELDKMGATSILITRTGDDRLDPGVAVWWTMKKEDFGWQQGLGLETPMPTFGEIDSAFKLKARKVHPDNSDGGDPEAFKRLAEWRTQAKNWITGSHAHAHEFVMGIDQYSEARLNLCALRLAFSYIRGLERVGAPAILTQTLGAFRAKLTGGSSAATTTA